MMATVNTGLGAVALGKRFIADHADKVSEIPFWGQIVLTLDALLFIPLLILLNYVLLSVFTTLAMVEDPDPSPSYAALTTVDEELLGDTAVADAGPGRKLNSSSLPTPSGGPITSGLFTTWRHLRSAGNPRMLIRSFACHLVTQLATFIVVAAFLANPFLIPFGPLIATLVLIQLHTVWVHIVISDQPNGPPFWRRLPPFGKTFNATKYAVALVWLADAVPVFFDLAVNKSGPRDGPNTLVSVALFCLCTVLVKLPAAVALVRVQASLLPSNEGTIVPFDRTFGGRVEPSHASDGKDYVSARDALRTFSRASWFRVVKMAAKGVLMNVGMVILMFFIVIIQHFFIVLSQKE